jgi:DNA-binding SARP family transcriptional activator/tetratricopeptide (TPR) repeat protein
MQRGTARVEFRLLGPVEAWTKTGRIEVGPPQRRAVLAALLVDPGQLVSTETLIDRVWGERAVPGARRALHAHIARIRQLLRTDDDGGHPANVVHRSNGYLLDVDPDAVDWYRFRNLTAAASNANLVDRDRVQLLAEALGLWRGSPLADLDADWAARIRRTWSQTRLDTAVRWAEVQLRLGQHSELIGPIRDLLADHPLAEPLAAALLRALVAAGRQAEALDTYATVRARLADELGTEPGPELRELHEAILRGELVPAKAAPGPAPSHRPPAQLPADVPGFTGRRDELALLDTILDKTARSEPTAVVISALAGTAGVGKTALAVRWAHRVRGQFPDGQLYVNLRGYDPQPPVSTAGALAGFLDALGVAGRDVPVDDAERSARYRSELADRRMLIVLDNASSVEQVRSLLPGTPSCVVVVTSRDSLPGLVARDGAQRIHLDLLPRAEAVDLLRRLLGGRVDAEPAAAAALADQCARLPLALRVAAELAAGRPGATLGELAAELADHRKRLKLLDAGGDARAGVAAVFSWSIRHLPADAARLFRLLGLHPGPDLDRHAAAALAGTDPAGATRGLATLVRAHLVHPTGGGRYGMHDLLRAYAVELAEADEPEAGRRAARRRLLDHYLHTAHAAAVLLYPQRETIRLGPADPGAHALVFKDHRQAMEWFTAEHTTLLATVAMARRTGLHTHTWQLAWALYTFLDRRGHWPEMASTQRIALAATRASGDKEGQAHAHRGIARAHTVLRRYEEAQAHYRRALRLFEELGDHANQARLHMNLAVAVARTAGPAEALRHSERARDLFRTAGYGPGEGNALNSIGWYHAQLGDFHTTLACSRRAVEVHRRVGNRLGEANALDSVGYAHHHLGEHAKAIDSFRRAVELYRDVGDRAYQAETLTHLGDAHHAVGDPGAARHAWLAALEILTDLGHPDAAVVREKVANQTKHAA